MKLPKKLPLDMMQDKWAADIEPVLNNPIVDSNLLKSISLIAGTNVVSHKLGRNLIGWYITRMRSNFTELYDLQDSNQTPQLTLVLVASANCVVDLQVF